MTIDREALVTAARAALEHSHSPYSRFRVGAALLGDDGKIYTGTNVENASYGLSICAERTAVFKAVSEGCRRFSACAVVTETDAPTPPCGACRQVLQEFAPALEIHLAGRSGTVETRMLTELLPRPFDTLETGGDL